MKKPISRIGSMIALLALLLTTAVVPVDAQTENNDSTSQATLPPDCDSRADRVLYQNNRFSIRCNSGSPLGVNISSASEFGTTFPFSDLFKSSEPVDVVHDQGTIVPVKGVHYDFDNDGWLTKLAPGFSAFTNVVNGVPDGHLPDRTYVVLYEGSGELRYHPGNDLLTNGARLENPTRIRLQIKGTDAGRPIHNIRVLPAGGVCTDNPFQVVGRQVCENRGVEFLSFRAHHRGALRFHPQFLNFVKDFNLLRYLDMMEINGSPIQGWNHQARLGDATWNSDCPSTCEGETGRHGVPVEIMVDLANTVNADVWFLMPHMARDGYVRRFATTVRDHPLRPGLNIHLEYSNETWNTAGPFGQSQYVIDQGCQLRPNLCPDQSYAAGEQFHVERSMQINKIWTDVLGSDRLTRVLARHFRAPQRSTSALRHQQAFRNFDALAVAPYFDIKDPEHRADAGQFVPPRSVDEVFTRIAQDRSGDWRNKVKAHRTIVERFNERGGDLDYITYEAGHHLSVSDARGNYQNLRNLYLEAMRDDRMSDQYWIHNTWWRCLTGNSLSVMFSSPSFYKTSNPGFFWGLKEHVSQKRVDAPKYDSVRSFIDANLTTAPDRRCADHIEGS